MNDTKIFDVNVKNPSYNLDETCWLACASNMIASTGSTIDAESVYNTLISNTENITKMFKNNNPVIGCLLSLPFIPNELNKASISGYIHYALTWWIIEHPEDKTKIYGDTSDSSNTPSVSLCCTPPPPPIRMKKTRRVFNTVRVYGNPESPTAPFDDLNLLKAMNIFLLNGYKLAVSVGFLNNVSTVGHAINIWDISFRKDITYAAATKITTASSSYCSYCETSVERKPEISSAWITATDNSDLDFLGPPEILSMAKGKLGTVNQKSSETIQVYSIQFMDMSSCCRKKSAGWLFNYAEKNPVYVRNLTVLGDSNIDSVCKIVNPSALIYKYN